MAIIVDMPDPAEKKVKEFIFYLLYDYLTASQIESALVESRCSDVEMAANKELVAYAERLADRLLYGDPD